MSDQKPKNTSSKLLPISILSLAAAIVIAPLIYRTYQNKGTQPVQEAVPKTTSVETLPGLDEAKSLSVEQRNWVIQKANQEQCACQCGHDIASCVKTDPSCPLHSKNLARIEALIQEAGKTKGT